MATHSSIALNHFDEPTKRLFKLKGIDVLFAMPTKSVDNNFISNEPTFKIKKNHEEYTVTRSELLALTN